MNKWTVVIVQTYVIANVTAVVRLVTNVVAKYRLMVLSPDLDYVYKKVLVTRREDYADPKIESTYQVLQRDILYDRLKDMVVKTTRQVVVLTGIAPSG